MSTRHPDQPTALQRHHKLPLPSLVALMLMGMLKGGNRSPYNALLKNEIDGSSMSRHALPAALMPNNSICKPLIPDGA
jgi:hypothetical protein